MGSSYSFLKSYFSSSIKMRLLLLGLDSAALLQTLKLGKSTTTIPTVGFNVENVDYKDIELNIWDVGGQDKLRPFWRHYYAGTSGIIFVVDSSDSDRLGKAKIELHNLLKEEELKYASLIIIANKQDIENCLTAIQISEAMDIKSLKPREINVLPVVGTTGQGVPEMLDWIHANMKPI